MRVFAQNTQFPGLGSKCRQGRNIGFPESQLWAKKLLLADVKRSRKCVVKFLSNMLCLSLSASDIDMKFHKGSLKALENVFNLDFSNQLDSS